MTESSIVKFSFTSLFSFVNEWQLCPPEVVRLFADCLGIYDFASQDPALEIQDFSRTFDFDTRLRHGGMLGIDLYKVS